MWQIDKYARVPIYEQVAELVERYVLRGILKPDEQMPSVRALSQTMNINPNTLQKAYAELERRGVCYAVPGGGRFVRTEARESIVERKKEQLKDLKRLANELYDVGVGIEEMLDCIRDAAKQAKEDHRDATE